ncbi:hypothetical protein [Micromonospora sp. RP3T]|uniref:hypothetical protein n=1 Tax=Micromonospora sp. RP3T TaxID=2135446 RepID=UPI000D1590FF|nr:hypothetical protein [Micromonospora sp. RP3T]PTA45174.1 hypothetical protein C8054_16345 [Micromonospora sp. RP3T]
MTIPVPLPARTPAPAVDAPPPLNDTPEELTSRATVLDPGRWAGRWGGLATLTGPPTVTSGDRAADSGPRAATPDAPAPASPARTGSGPPQPTGASGVPQWVDAGEWDAEGRARLRRALTDRYDAYARVVTRTLAEEPGLRAAGHSADLVGDLVALCAYVADPAAVNHALRGSGERPPGAAALLARGAASGLCRLPTVIGPVYATTSAPPALDYRAGDELVEPAFVDVRLSGGAGPDVAVEYVIWSVSARRIDPFTWPARPAAAFPPGSRFAVLAVDDPDGDGPVRVLLRDRTGERPAAAGRGEEMLRRLRANATGAGLRGPVTMDFPIGLDDRGHRFVPDRPADATPARLTAPVSGGSRR